MDRFFRDRITVILTSNQMQREVETKLITSLIPLVSRERFSIGPFGSIPLDRLSKWGKR